MTKTNGLIILGVISLSLIFHPRVNHVLTQKFQPKTAYTGELTAAQLWEIRDFGSIGSFTQVNTLPSFVTGAFPSLASLPFSRALVYTSDTIQSVDFIMSQDDLDRFRPIIDTPLPPNSTISITRADQTWVVGVFDAQTALKVNGYFSDIMEGNYWVHIGTRTD